MATAAAMIGIVLLGIGAALGSGLLVFALVRSEHSDRTVMDREAAERTARRDHESRNRE